MNLTGQSSHASPPGRRGFTLIEILVATMAFAVLLAALQGVLASALKLRREAGERIQAVETHRQAARVLERDLANGLLNGGLLAQTLLGETEIEQGGRSDFLELHTTTGRVDDHAPWGEVQRVAYYLATQKATQNRTGANRQGRTLVRATYRNLLGEVDEPTKTTALLRDVASFEVAYYDGTTWEDAWDSTQRDDAPPVAMRVLIRFVDHPERAWRELPLELIVPWTAQPRPAGETAEAAGADAESGGGETPPGGGGGPQPPGGGGSGPTPGGGGRQ